jgi:minor extracellular serine protease Vpr
MRIKLLIAGCLLSAHAALATESSVPHIEADWVHAMGYRGQGVTVAVLDTGIDYSHPGLEGSIHPWGQTFEFGKELPQQGADVYDEGHGTYVSLIITDESGVAPELGFFRFALFGE